MQHLQPSPGLSDSTAVPAPGTWLTPGRFFLILSLLIFAAFAQVVLGLQTFVVRDFGFFAYPLAHFQRDCFWRGELPFWNPYNTCGVPFLAQWNTMPLYPPALIYLVLPLSWSLSMFCLLHQLWAGLGMYTLAYRWTGNRLAASVAGLIFSFNGLSLNLLMWPSHIATYSWIPWVIFAVERAWREGGRKLIPAVICGALQMLAGGPETIFFTWLFLSLLWVGQCVRRLRHGSAWEKCVPLAATWRFPLMVLLVAALCAAQLLPFLDLAAHSQREQGYADTRWSMPLRGFANFLVPMAFGRVANMGVFFQPDQQWTSSYYFGVAALVLGALALWTARHARTWLLALVAGGALLLALGDQTVVYRGLRHFIPQLSLMTYPVKFLLLLSFAVPLLAAFGLARAQETDEIGRKKKQILLAAVIGLVLTTAILIWCARATLPGDLVSTTIRNGAVRVFFLVAIAGTLWWVLSLSQTGVSPSAGKQDDNPTLLPASRARMLAPALLIFFIWLDVWTHEPTQNPTAPPFIYAQNLARNRLVMDPQPALGKSRAMVSPAAATRFREFAMSNPRDNFLVKRLGLFADCNLLDDVPKIDGFLSLYPREAGELNSVLYASTNLNLGPLADFMGVSQITAPGEFFKWRPRDSFHPLVTAGQTPFFAADPDVLAGLFSTNFDASQIVLLPLTSRASVAVTNRADARILSSRFENSRVEVEVDSAAPCLLVAAQTYYHRWRAFIDEQPAPLLRANYAFQAVQMPAGRHQLKLVYQDRAFTTGLVISVVAILCLLIPPGLRGRARSQAPAA